MTIGENIQKRRKSLGLSQEELGQKLLVSRQTVSLWEKDETVPTLDNLIRLKELFGVSVDELLGIGDQIQTEESAPKEVYQFQLSEAEWKQIDGLQMRTVYRGILISVLLSLAMFVFCIFFSDRDVVTGVFFGVFLFVLVAFLKSFRVNRKALKSSLKTRCETVYEYRVFENYMIIKLYRGGERVRESKNYFADIEKVYAYSQWLLIQFAGQYFPVRKSELKEDSSFYSFIRQNPPKVVHHDASSKWKTISALLFTASILSLFGGLMLINLVTVVNSQFIKNTWLFFVMTPIPIGSTVFGFVMKSKGPEYKKNIIGGIIMTILLCIYGSFAFIF